MKNGIDKKISFRRQYKTPFLHPDFSEFYIQRKNNRRGTKRKERNSRTDKNYNNTKQ